MKRLMNLLTVSVLLGVTMLVALPAQRASAQPGAYVSYQEFYDDLAPYGQWIEDPQYGYVWVPYAEDNFRPYYSHGYWVMTEYGNTWVSDYPWGWAPFHYGRWIYDAYYGWVWVPGSEWGPAWVSWRYGYGYYGWAPLAPGFSITIGFGNYWCPDDWWVFLPPHYIYRPRYYNYWRGPRENTVIIRNTTIIHNTYVNPHTNGIYVTGPRAEEVQRVTNQPVRIYHVNPATRPGTTNVNGDAITLYRPVTVQSNMPNGNRPIPNNIVRATQPVGKPAAVSVNEGQRPPFRTGVPPKAPVTQPQVQPQVQPPQPPVQRQPQVQPPQPPVQRQPNVQPPQPPVQRQPNVQPPQPPVQRQPNVQPPQPPVQRQPNVQPPQPPVQRQPNYQPPQPPVQRQPNYQPPRPPVQQQRPPSPPPVQRQPSQPPVQRQQQNNSNIRR